MKSRMSALDIRCSVEELRKRIMGMRVANIYDLTSRTYVFKFSRTDEKVMVILESGVRVHITEYGRDKGIGAEGPKVPSGFTMRLRKSIRMKKLVDVKQLGVDRVVQFTFVAENEVVYLFLELYSQGNLIITDESCKITTLLRTRKHDESVSTVVGDTYDAVNYRKFSPMTLERLISLLQTAKPTDNIKQAINMQSDYGPHLSEHCAVKSGIKPSMKVSDLSLQPDNPLLLQLLKCMNEADDLILTAKDGVLPGYIILKPTKENPKAKAPAQASTPAKEEMIFYEEFHPVLFDQFQSSQYLEFPNFSKASDEFFSKLEAQKVEQQRKSQEDAVLKKLEKARTEHQQRIKSLQSEQETNEMKAQLIEYNLEDVDRAILVIRSLLAQSMDWEEVTRIWKEERKKGNPVASIIHQLKFESNQITLLLNDNLDDADEEELTKPTTKVDVDLGVSAYANACRYFEHRKKAEHKQQKTIESTKKAMKAAEEKTNQALKQVRMTAAIKQIRKPFWFEKFNWFITSENFLVIAGRDAQQNEVIVKKYMGKNDIYVHADIHGASSCVVKNNSEAAIPPLTLTQAGTFCVCLSNAWSAKIVTSAYWVFPNQVSKTAPSGEYLTTGSFMIRGKKNYLPPTTLAMGFGFLFKIDDSCIPYHINDRVIRTDDTDQKAETTSIISEASSLYSVDVGNENDIAVEDFDSDDEKEDGKEDEDTGNAPEGEEANSAADAVPPSPEQPPKFYVADKFSHLTVQEATNPAESAASQSPAPVSSVIRSPQEVAMSLLEGAEEDENEKAAEGYNEDAEDGDDAQEEEEDAEEEDEQPKQTNQKEAKTTSKGNGKANAQAGKEKQSQEKPQQSAPRGKKGKLKKMKTKYADQDEEEREMRMALLQSAAKKKEEKKEEKTDSKNQRPKKYSNKSQPKAQSEDKPAAIENRAEKKSEPPKPKQHSEKDEIRKVMEEENIAVLEDEDRDKLTNLNLLVENPLPEDIILYAVPVCGPYNSMQKFKFKVKVTPGTMKKGKAVKAAVDIFAKLPVASALEKELMKQVSVNDMSQALLSDVKLSAPGLLLAKAERKKAMKEKAKSDVA